MASYGMARQTHRSSKCGTFLIKTQIYFQAYVSIFFGIFSVYAHVITAHKQVIDAQNTGSSNTNDETHVESTVKSAQLAQDDLEAATPEPEVDPWAHLELPFQTWALI